MRRASRSTSCSPPIPAVAVAALSFFGDLVEGSADAEAGAVYVGLTSLALVLLVIGAARAGEHARRQQRSRRSASRPLVGALALLGLQLAVWTSLRLSRDRLVNAQRSPTPDV